MSNSEIFDFINGRECLSKQIYLTEDEYNETYKTGISYLNHEQDTDKEYEMFIKSQNTNIETEDEELRRIQAEFERDCGHNLD